MANVERAYRTLRQNIRNMTAQNAITAARRALISGDRKTYHGRLAHYGATRSARPFGDGEPFNVGTSMAWWIETPELLGMRDCGNASEITNARHTGWFTDDIGSVAMGAVYRWGRFYVPAIRDPHNDGPIMLLWHDRVSCADGQGDASAHNTALVETARAADAATEIYAEREREHDAAYQAGALWGQLKAENSEARKKALALIAEVKTSGGYRPAVCTALKEKLADWLTEISVRKDKMAKLADGEAEGLLFFPGDEGLMVSFKEGAGQ